MWPMPRDASAEQLEDSAPVTDSDSRSNSEPPTTTPSTEKHTISDPSYYARLGCDESSTAQQIAAEYRRLALRAHPDHNGGVAASDWEALRQAYATLADPAARRGYDAWRQAGLLISYQDFVARQADRGHLHFAARGSSQTRPITSGRPLEDSRGSEHAHDGWGETSSTSDAGKFFRSGWAFK
eukprot:m.145357 g.145357  ORF g.145357 m.145357 type:complete len:183 (-) comp14117_c0_seq12:5075-5623(-)